MEIVFIVWVGLAFVASSVARSKGRSGFGFFALSFLFSFLVAIIVLAIVPSKVTTYDPVPKTKCPYCREEIIADAIVCKHCGRDVEPDLELISKAFDAGFPKSKPLSASGKWGGALILVGALSLLSWISGIKDWPTPMEFGPDLLGRVVALIVELGILASGIVLYLKAIKRANDSFK